MIRNLAILSCAAAVVALPFLFRQPGDWSDWDYGDPELSIISAHNEAIRHEFARAFSAWHAEHYGQPVKVEWRTIGGTSEIMRYLAAEYVAAFRPWWRRQGNRWPSTGSDDILDRRFRTDSPPPDDAPEADRRRWEQKRAIWSAFRDTDDPAQFTAKIDLFFGGGEYDHTKAFTQGLTVSPWSEGALPPELQDIRGEAPFPDSLSGEVWRTPYLFGAAVSTFGICYNPDRLRDLGISEPPRAWRDLTHPAYAGQVGVSDPTKSGSISKAFEMITHQACYERIRAAGFSDPQISAFEDAIRRQGGKDGRLPDGVPAAYQQALEEGWLEGVQLLQAIGANARYFTDSSSKIPIDVGMGDAAAGIAIDFYGRYQAEKMRGPRGEERMVYITPRGGSSVSADPISLLRGAPRREVAVRFIRFVLSEEGQRLWCYRPGTPGGPNRYALRRLPIRREFYPSTLPALAEAFARHRPHLADDLADPEVNPYALAEEFTYRPRWTSNHFAILRTIVRAMCLDSGEELRAAWRAILRQGGPEAHPEAMARLRQLPRVPEPLTWQSAPGIPSRHDEMAYMREWTLFFRGNYRAVRRMVEPPGAAGGAS